MSAPRWPLVFGSAGMQELLAAANELNARLAAIEPPTAQESTVTNPTRITPTVGRKVYWYVNEHQPEPYDATIVRVHGEPSPDSPVNLHVKDPNSSEVFFRSAVPVGDEKATGEHYRWMPYQLGQAAGNIPTKAA